MIIGVGLLSQRRTQTHKITHSTHTDALTNIQREEAHRSFLFSVVISVPTLSSSPSFSLLLFFSVFSHYKTTGSQISLKKRRFGNPETVKRNFRKYTTFHLYLVDSLVVFASHFRLHSNLTAFTYSYDYPSNPLSAIFTPDGDSDPLTTRSGERCDAHGWPRSRRSQSGH